MSNYKIIASDLDGTLLNSYGGLSKENQVAIKKISEKGVNIVLSTGRTLCEIPEPLKNNPNISYLIGSNGAGVWDIKTGKKLVSLAMKNNVSTQVFKILKDYDCNITYRYNGQSYADKTDWDEEKMDYYNICLPHNLAIRNYAIFLNNFFEISEKLDKIETFAVFFHSKTEMEECRTRLLNTSELLVVRAWDCNLEIFDKNSGKGNALRHLAENLNINIKDTIAVGDSNNDKTMVETAGLGLCVSNGIDTLKEKSDEIICSNDEHIMEYILNHYI